ncbi:MAG: hypothetical protein ACYDDS_10470 [Candidatus Sulfotelmatobacter sp.]
MDLRSKIRLLGLTFVLAAVMSYLLIIVLPDYLFLLAFVILWVTLYFYWPTLRRWRAFLKPPKASAPRTPAPKRPLGLRLVRGTLKWAGGTGLVLVLLSMIVAVPIGLCFGRAKKAHNSIHIGMTVPEVLHAVTDCDLFGASSESPYDDKADADNIPALHLGRGKDGTYRMYDLAARQDIRMSESEAIERLHEKLHDGYQWHFYYTYVNVTPMHVTFSVVFGPDGRVTEVKPVYGWD